MQKSRYYLSYLLHRLVIIAIIILSKILTCYSNTIMRNSGNCGFGELCEVDENAMNQAIAVLQEIGMDMSTAINIYLTQVWVSESIHFLADIDQASILDLNGYSMEQCFRAAVQKAIAETKARGNPIGLYGA